MFQTWRLKSEMAIGLLLITVFCVVVGCQSGRNFEPELNAPTRVYFSIGIENSINLSALDSDGDELRYGYRFLNETPPDASFGDAFLVPMTGGAVFTWSLGMDAVSLIGDIRQVEFSVDDGRGGRTVAVSEVWIVDPFRYGTRGLRLSLTSPDGYLVSGQCIQPVEFGVMTGGLSSELTAFSIRHGPLGCPEGEGCLPLLETLSETERRLSWCATEGLLRRSRDHELEIKVGRDSGASSFTTPVQFRFIEPSDSDCTVEATGRFELVEGIYSDNMADIRVAIRGDFGLNPMVSVLPSGVLPSNRQSLNGFATHNLRYLGGDQWQARFAWPFAVNEGDTIGLLFSSLVSGVDCQRIHLSDVTELSISGLSQGASSFNQSCAPCIEDVDCTRGRCVVLDGQGRCGGDCQEHRDCPANNLCVMTETVDGRQSTQCLPEKGTCHRNCDNRLTERNVGAVWELEQGETAGLDICIGLQDDFLVRLATGEGIRLSVSSTGESGLQASPGLSVSIWGEGTWDVWHSSSETIYELPCASSDLNVLAAVWSWWGSGGYQISAERLVGGCVDGCSPDRLEPDQTPLRVSQPSVEEGLTLCDLDTDAFDVEQDENESWRLELKDLSERARIRVRVLRLPTLEVLLDKMLANGEGLGLSAYGEGRFRFSLSNGGQGSVPTYSTAFTREPISTNP